MTEYIPKSTLVAEIDKRIDKLHIYPDDERNQARSGELYSLKQSISTLEVKEVDEQKERMSECPYRKVGCTMYEDKILECKGACSWFVDYPKLKELKAQKGEEV